MKNDKNNLTDSAVPLPDLQKLNDLNRSLKQVDEAARIVEAYVQNLQASMETFAASALEEEREKLENILRELARRRKYKSN